ncbi:MAG TPA: hypothetical protein VFA23_00920 [Dongiaceae bacterium]|nr:hypothetical protein [Dongiaceae bacterium]
MRPARAAALALLLAAPAAGAQPAVAPDDPALIRNMTRLCLRAALSSGGVDRTTRTYCGCVAPVLARHMTPESRYRLAIQDDLGRRPEFDDPKAAYAEVVRACPPAE